jgi:hypothetical protein
VTPATLLAWHRKLALAANVAHDLGHGLTGAVVPAWPAVGARSSRRRKPLMMTSSLDLLGTSETLI